MPNLDPMTEKCIRIVYFDKLARKSPFFITFNTDENTVYSTKYNEKEFLSTKPLF